MGTKISKKTEAAKPSQVVGSPAEQPAEVFQLERVAMEVQEVPRDKDEDAVGKLVEEVRRLQKLECKNQLDIIRHRIAIGAVLVKLKAKAKHGTWTKRRDELGFDERSAQRLMKLSQSELAKQIRVNDPDLTRWLPTDVQKLDTLSQLSAAKLKESLEAWKGEIETMSRKQLRDAVAGVPGVKRNDEPGKKANQESVADQSKQTAMSSTGKEPGPPTLAKKGVAARVTQEKPTGQSWDSSDSGGELVEPSPCLDSLVALCEQIDVADLKAGVIEEIAAKRIDKVAAGKAIKTLANTIATLKEIVASLGAV